jgi:photosystem II stability/assembly factor-like uncharacterized protein
MSETDPPDPGPVEPDPDEPDPDVDPDPVSVVDAQFAEQVLAFDAPQTVKSAGTTLGAQVRRPGEAETVPAGPAGPRTAVPGAHNWVPIGPRNVGGRVRAVAVDPSDRRIMYAAPASGGVYKSLDGAESWFPLWHDEPSLSMSALDICRDHHDVVWAATGEVSQSRSGGAPLPTAGVLRSEDGGATWTKPDADEAIPPNANKAVRSDRLHAVAAHPTQKDVCWAVGLDGVYRTTDKGQTWTQFAKGRSFSDVAFARFGAVLRLYLVLSGSVEVTGKTRRGVVVRIDDPDTNPNLTAILPAAPARDTVVAAGKDPLLANGGITPVPTGKATTRDGKLAIFEDAGGGGADPVLYVAFADTDGHGHGVFRCRNPNVAVAKDMAFAPLARAAPFATENWGSFNLAIAVSPANANHLAFGMQALFLNRDANANVSRPEHWLLAQMGDLYHVDRGHHADHHALVFAGVPAAPFDGAVDAGTILLWDANDGGLSVSTDWATGTGYATPTPPPPQPLPAKLPAASLPLPERVMTWRKRSHGIGATQMYDLTQHPRLPAVLGCGFQDNGVWIGTGGPSWQFVLGADGGFVAFDPDDAYRLLATHQNGVTEVRFPGKLRDALPLLRDGVQRGFWPRELTEGLRSSDRDLFVAPTYFHPSLPGRAFTARRNRLYGTRATTGDRWQPEPLGGGVEILHEPTVADPQSSTLEVHDTAGGRALGLPAQRNITERREDARCVSRVRTLAVEPFTIPNGESLRLSFSTHAASGRVRTINVLLTVGDDLPQNASSGKLAAYLTKEITGLLAAKEKVQAETEAKEKVQTETEADANRPTVTALPVVGPVASSTVHVVTTDAGRDRQIELDGDALPLLNAVRRIYRGADAQRGGPGVKPEGLGQALPAMAEFELARKEHLEEPGEVLPDEAGRTVDLSGKSLEISREGGTAKVTIGFDADAPDPSRVRCGDLIDILRARLPAASYSVVRGGVAWGVRMTAPAPGATVKLKGDLVDDLARTDGLDPGATGRSVRINRRTTFDLRPASRRAGDPLTDRHLLVEAGQQTALQALDDTFMGVEELTAVTAVELIDAIRRMLAAAPAVRVRCDLDIHPVHTLTPTMFELSQEGVIREVAFGPAGSQVVWAGDEAGRLYRSTNDGESWAGVPAFPASDRFGVVEALAVAPDAPNTVYAGLFESGVFTATTTMLFRTDDGGDTWASIGDGIEDAASHRIGLSSIAIDPAAPSHVFVGTEVGVFGSTDRGATFEPFNEGLPNAPVVDLAFEPTTRMLRAGLWGRGVYERHVGDRPPKDVRLHIRSTALDDGTAQPYPGPDLLSSTPAPLAFDASPDVKQTRRDPRRGLVLDGAEFDDELRHEDVREGSAFICVQVHNRGAFPTSSARIAVLWAPADNGPPPLGSGLAGALAAGPLARGAMFDAWTVIADDPLADPHNAGHNVVAPGYPRIAVVGAPPRAFQWGPADLFGHRRIGLLVLCRCTEDPLSTSSTDVLDLVRSEAKAAYRECAVVLGTEDSRIVLRATGPVVRTWRRTVPAPPTPGFRVEAPTKTAAAPVQDLANGGAPLGLPATAGQTAVTVREVVLARAEPYNLAGAEPWGFRISIEHDLTVLFTADELVRNPQSATADEVAAILNRQFIAAGLPLRAAPTSFQNRPRDLALFLNGLGTATILSSGTAATRMGIATAQEKASVVNDFAHRGPWDLRPSPTPLDLRVVVRTAVEIRLGVGTPGLPDPAAATAAEVRAAINRQLAIGGATGVEAVPRRLALSVRRSATEAAPTRVVSGSYALADVVAASARIADPDARLRTIAAHDRDAVTAAQRNFLYARVANVGTVGADPARVRVFEVGTPVTPPPQLATVTQVLATGDAAIVELPFNLDARPSGARVFALVVVDTEADALDPPDVPSLDEAHTFCLEHAGAALRELVVA